ncbi:hypothetical protein B566_EDAN012628 [Ephemera danica]|nr:hypothetical protein B566_EDAN012628 [Ephemera danica]
MENPSSSIGHSGLDRRYHDDCPVNTSTCSHLRLCSLQSLLARLPRYLFFYRRGRPPVCCSAQGKLNGDI